MFADYDLIEHLRRQMQFSLKTFGSGNRTPATIKHIKDELEEISERYEEGDNGPDILEEWIDVCLLSLDGAWRSGPFTPQDVVGKLFEKFEKNLKRKWDVPENFDPNTPINHVRGFHD